MPLSATQISLDRMVNAIAKARKRLLRTTSALQKAGVHYALAGENAAAAWVSTIDESAVRNTPSINILVCREHLDVAKRELTLTGFVERSDGRRCVFVDGPDGRMREAVHLAVTDEREHVIQACEIEGLHIVDLEFLVRSLLANLGGLDQLSLRDLIDVGLIDASWPARFTPELSARLQSLLDTPEG